jgi:hypothetical protein
MPSLSSRMEYLHECQFERARLSDNAYEVHKVDPGNRDAS